MPRFQGLKCLPTLVINLHGPIDIVVFVFLNWAKEERLKGESQDTEKQETWIGSMAPSALA